ncbi:hypothetical protein Syun_027116 [Stephania yunnanensis]|uniref:Uncharacterized protein n=1 Tax=Stephania yunnanensis TaxID=152371 RepID=A0AAP0HR04_9MAGN
MALASVQTMWRRSRAEQRATAEAGPTSGGEDCGRDEAEGGGWGILRAATVRFDYADGGARTAEGGATPTAEGGATRPAVARGSNAAARDCPTCGGGWGPTRRRAGSTSGGSRHPTRRRRRLACSRRRRVTSAADLALRARATCGDDSRAGDGAATVGGALAAVRRVSSGGHGESPAVVADGLPAVVAVGKMGLEVKWVWRGENGFGGR